MSASLALIAGYLLTNLFIYYKCADIIMVHLATLTETGFKHSTISFINCRLVKSIGCSLSAVVPTLSLLFTSASQGLMDHVVWQ